MELVALLIPAGGRACVRGGGTAGEWVYPAAGGTGRGAGNAGCG